MILEFVWIRRNVMEFGEALRKVKNGSKIFRL